MVEFDYYERLLESSENAEIERTEQELFNHDEDTDIDLWTRVDLDKGDKKYRITFTEDHSPVYDRTHYEVKISEKKPLKLEDGWTNWRKVEQERYENYRQSSFKTELVGELSEYFEIDGEEFKQSTLN